MMKVIPETCRVHQFRYLHFYYCKAFFLFFQVNICPQESLAHYHCVSDNGEQPHSLPPGVGTSGIWFSDQPMSLPTSTNPFTSNLPHFNVHYNQVRHHNEQLQQELSENIRTFLQRHEDSMDVPVSTILSDHCLQSSISTSAPSLNQVPSLTNVLIDSGASDSSRSYLFSSLR